MKSKLISVALPAGVALLLTATACAPTRTAAVTDATREAARIEYRERLRIDSVRVHIRDSVRVRERGDTVFVEKFRTQTLYRERLRTDTISVVDTVRVTRIETLTEETNRLTGWQHFQIWLGRIAIALTATFIAFKRFLK